MGIINILDTEISNKIAAGEVVERPASVIKELVENSIDAGAKRISVEIKNGGNTYIKVTDDGKGMQKDDACVAFLRHATSKIQKEEDLDAIFTLGFRGEALSSIGAVAEVDLYTKRREDLQGTHTVCTGGEIVSSEDAAIPDGTTFIVKNLFYNVPARRKFLKKDATEAAYIQDIMTRFIFAHPEISFRLVSNGKPVLTSAGDGNLKSCVYAVYGKDFSASMIDVDYETEYVKVTGLIGGGSLARPNRNYQSFYVNRRYIKSPLMMRALDEGYKNQIMIGKFATAILNIEINPALVDINVHPTKLEVKFSNESDIYSAVYGAVKEALYRIEAPLPKKEKAEAPKNFVGDVAVENAQIKLFENKPIKEEKVIESKKTEVAAPPKEEKPISVFEEKRPLVVEQPKMFERPEFLESKKEESVTKTPKAKEIKQSESFKIEEKAEKEAVPVIEVKEEIKPDVAQKKEVLNAEFDFKLIGQVFDTYIIIECGDEIKLIDQHAAHERLQYEQLKKNLENSKVYSQTLLIAETLNLSAVEMTVFRDNKEFISSIGFDAEEFGQNKVIIRAVPQSYGGDDAQDLFVEILSQLAEFKKEIISEKRQRLLYTIACKSAVKANCKMSDAEQIELVKMVFSLEGINTCPHGRPIVVTYSKKDIEKEFKRIV